MRFTLLFLLISGSLLAQEKRFFTRETFQLMTDHQTRFERQYSLFKGDSAIISDYMNDVLQLQATIYGAVNLQVIDGVISIPRVNEYMLFCRSMGAGSSYRPHFAKVKAKLKFYFDGKPDRYILVNADRFRFA